MMGEVVVTDDLELERSFYDSDDHWCHLKMPAKNGEVAAYRCGMGYGIKHARGFYGGPEGATYDGRSHCPACGKAICPDCRMAVGK